MRDPFPYESNGLLLSQYLVPDPLSREEFKDLEAGWAAAGEGKSFLEWIIGAGGMSETGLMQALEKATGRRFLKTIVCLEKKEWTAGMKFLSTVGFTPGKDPEGRPVVYGGTALAPNLKEFLGGKWPELEWVLASPVRTEEERPVYRDISIESRSPAPGSRIGERLSSLLVEAATRGQSDMYFERYGHRLVIRGRGTSGTQVLAEWDEPACTESLRLLKRWANLSTATTSLPQDGRLVLNRIRPAVSYRVSHVHAVGGESLVLRIIGRESLLPGPKELGIPEQLSGLLRDCLIYEHGLVLCTGITGSGKTTTMCSVVSSLKSHSLKILTIEDPIEYELSNATQSAVNHCSGWSFREALAAYLRQDPDIILVGEIRDRESASMACQAGLTGHCVLSSLHARSPAAALDRLKSWDLAPGLLAESIRLVIHQRLELNENTGRRAAVFNWIHPEPGETYGYLVEGIVPPNWP